MPRVNRNYENSRSKFNVQNGDAQKRASQWAIHRSVEKADGAYTLREHGEAYNAVSRGKSEPLSIQNNFLRYSVGCIVRSDPR